MNNNYETISGSRGAWEVEVEREQTRMRRAKHLKKKKKKKENIFLAPAAATSGGALPRSYNFSSLPCLPTPVGSGGARMDEVEDDE